MESGASERRCPFCAELVQQAAITCRHCQHCLKVDLRFRSQLEERAVHGLALQIMRHRPGQFTYQELSNLLSDSHGTLLPNVPYDEAQKLLSQLSGEGLSSLSITFEIDGRIDENLTDSAAIQANAKPTTPVAVWAFWLALLIASISGVVYIAKQPALFSTASPILPPENTPKPDLRPVEIDTPTLTSNKRRRIAEALVQATVTIHEGNALGSGFFVRNDGYLLTNAHVIRDMRNPTISLEDGRSFPARVLRTDDFLDLAVLKVEGKEFPTLELGDATALSRGDRVWTIGAPQGMVFSLTRGIISYVGRPVRGVAYLQSDAAINQGNSGGPLIDEKGRVIGINTFILRNTEGMAFSLPINYAVTGTSPVLAGVLPPRISNTQMERWFRLAESEPRQDYNARMGTNPPLRPAQPRQSALLRDLLDAERRLSNNFNVKMKRLEAEKLRLQREKQAIEKQYHSDRAFSMTITNEAILGRRLKNAQRNLIQQEIRILKHSVAFHDSLGQNFKKSLAYANTDALRLHYTQRSAQAASQAHLYRQRLEAKRAELTKLEAKSY